MKKMFIKLTLGIIAILLIQSCDNQKIVLKDVPNDKIEKTYNVKLSETLIIEIAANPSTGFQWILANKIKPKIVTEIGKEFVKDDRTMDLVGAGGNEVWRFSTEKPGETILYFVYQRDDGKIEKEKYFKIVVVE
jgi:inhibitor of cysteine peptidase